MEFQKSLVQAIDENNVEKTKYLIINTNVLSFPIQGEKFVCSYLFYACHPSYLSWRRKEIIKLLLEYEKPDFNVINKYDSSVVKLCMCRKHNDIITLLLENPNYKEYTQKLITK